MARSGPWARLQVLQNSGSQMFMFRVKPYQREITTDEIQESKIYGECSNLKSTCVCALTGSVPRKMAKGQQRVSASTGNPTRAGQGNSTHLDHLTMGLCQSSERNGE